MQLNDEQRLQVEQSLTSVGYRLSRKQFNVFVSNVEHSIAICSDIGSDIFSSEAKKALSRLWGLAQEDDPPVGQIRATIEKLPKGALSFIERRLASGAHLQGVADFRLWAHSAEPSDLVHATRKLSAFGASWQPGRSRGLGRRSGPRLQPIVEQIGKGGRPTNEGKFGLIAFLAVDWLCATGDKPKPGRETVQGFGYLVYSVFEWLDLVDEGENGLHALRQYWEAVRDESEED